MTIRAIIFDCFGVLATDGLLPFRERYFGDKPDLMQEARDLGGQVNAGLANYDDYIHRMAEMAGVTVAEARRQIESNVPDERLFAYIERELKPHYKIGILSNAGENWLDEIFTKEQLALFDAVALSYEIGVVKPDPRAYQIIANRLGIPPETCVFTDDQERYCTAAREAGMQAIYYQGVDDLRARFAQISSQS